MATSPEQFDPAFTPLAQAQFYLPFKPWNRLEGRPRSEDFDRVMKAEIHDALWMLTRQWQFGEFKGEDTGTAVGAKIQVENARLSRMQMGKQKAKAFSDAEAPLEAQIERLPVPMDDKRSARLGRWWLRQLNIRGNAYNLAKGLSKGQKGFYEKDAYKALFVELFPFAAPQDPVTDSPDLIVEAQQMSNQRLKPYLSALAGRMLHGGDMWAAIERKNDPFEPTMASSKEYGSIDKAHQAWVNDLAKQFLEQVPGFPYQPSSKNTNWVEPQLEYQAACSLPDPEGGHLALVADEYPGGKLDWYAFDIDPSPSTASGLTGSNPGIPEPPAANKVLEVIPADVRFAGMPATRWWEFEDAVIDFGKMQNDPSDLGRILMTEFAFLYSNDWFVVPFKLPLGSFSRIKGIVVTDVFGEKTWVEAAGGDDPDDWNRWGLFQLSQRSALPDGSATVERGLFLPPTIAQSQHSESLETISLVRDEMANLVWAIEETIPDNWDAGRDGFEAANQYMRYLKGLLGISETADEDQPAGLSYQLAGTMPENWIPFIPVQVDGAKRSIQLQRAAMPRILEGQIPTVVRPRSELLRSGLKPDNQISQSLYLYEEEVPRAGVNITTQYQRTRWHEGRSLLWRSHQKRTGRGGGNSGLRFDQVE